MYISAIIRFYNKSGFLRNCLRLTQVFVFSSSVRDLEFICISTIYNYYNYSLKTNVSRFKKYEAK